MTFYKPSQAKTVFKKVGFPKPIKNNKGISYYNMALSFDIETTSFMSNNLDKQAIMYEWSFSIGGVVIIGRTWDEFKYLISELIEYYELCDERRMIIYVHNLAYEFQFMRKLFEWKSVFSLDSRKPVKALTFDGVEFRCSLQLSGYSLKKLGEQLIKHDIRKLTGDLDYNVLRHSKTPLTEKEYGYCINDVQVVVAYIQETIERCGDITKIPLTKTGFVRDYLRRLCLYGSTEKRNIRTYEKYRKLMKRLTMTPPYIRLVKTLLWVGSRTQMLCGAEKH